MVLSGTRASRRRPAACASAAHPSRPSTSVRDVASAKQPAAEEDAARTARTASGPDETALTTETM